MNGAVIHRVLNSGGPSPIWMVAMWVNLAATLHVSLRILTDRRIAAAILGAVGGPLAYFAGARLGALRIGEPSLASGVLIAVEWALAMPLLLAVSGWIRCAGSSSLDGSGGRDRRAVKEKTT